MVTKCLGALALCGGISFVSISAQGTNGDWIPFSAHYKESIVAKDTSGNIVQNKQSLTSEKRSSDGAMMTVESKNSQNVSGKIWQADGKRVEISYAREQAYVAGQSPRRHLGIPPGTPTGSDTVAGLNCSVYPVHMANGGGTICVDITDDIMAKEELRFEAGGLRQHYLKELTSIDLLTPVDDSEFKVPAGFKMFTASPLTAPK